MKRSGVPRKSTRIDTMLPNRERSVHKPAAAGCPWFTRPFFINIAVYAATLTLRSVAQAYLNSLT